MFRIRTIIASALIACAASCAFAGLTNVQPSGWLWDYDRLGHVGGVPLEQVWIHPEFDVRDYKFLYIAPVQIDPLAYRRGGEADHRKAQRLAEAYRNVLYQELKAAGIFDEVSIDPYWYTVHDHALSLETRITEIYSGKPRLRTIVGFGAGATEVQIEGRVIEHQSCRTLAEYADRRLHPGGGIWNRPSDDSEFLIGIDMKQILRGVVKLFIFLREEGPPTHQR